MVLSQYEAVPVNSWWYWVRIELVYLYILRKSEIWPGVTNPKHTHRQEKIEQLNLLRSKGGALITQWPSSYFHVITLLSQKSCSFQINLWAPMPHELLKAENMHKTFPMALLLAIQHSFIWKLLSSVPDGGSWGFGNMTKRLFWPKLDALSARLLPSYFFT